MRNIQLIPANASPAEVKAYFRAAIEWLPGEQSSCMQSPIVDVALGTTIGSVRTTNEDRVAVIRTKQDALNSPWYLFAVCDGMGGMKDGENAAVNALSIFLATALSSRLGPTKENLLQSIDAANKALFDELKTQGGATLSACFWDHKHLLIANVGDSRVWIKRADKELEQVTQDDNLAGQLKKQGISVSSDIRNELLQFVGMGNEVQPHVFEVDAKTGDTVIITSDGIHRIHTDTLNRVVVSASSPASLVERLLSLSIWNGGEDNASVIVCRLPKACTFQAGNADLWTPCSLHRLVRGSQPLKPEMQTSKDSESLGGASRKFDNKRDGVGKKSQKTQRATRSNEEDIPQNEDKGQVDIQISPDGN